MAQGPTLRDAAAALLAGPHSGGGGKVIAVCAGTSGLGTSFVARELALAIGETGRAALIADMDITAGAQYAWFAAQASTQPAGSLSGPYDAAYGHAPFWSVTPAMAGADAQTTYGALYQDAARNVAVTAFMWQTVKDGQTVQVTRAPDYWQALRDHYGAILVDVPALDRSGFGGAIFADADACVLVAQSAQDTANQTALKAIAEAGGTCAGVILNQKPAAQAQNGVAP